MQRVSALHIHELPTDVVRLILSLFERRPRLVVVALVCRRWATLCREGVRRVTGAMVSEARAAGHLRAFPPSELLDLPADPSLIPSTVTRLTLTDKTSLEPYVPYLTRLRRLDLRGLGVLPAGVHLLTSLRTLLLPRSTLGRDDAERLTHLEALEVRDERQRLHALLPLLPRLAHLRLPDLYWAEDVKLPRVLPALTSLDASWTDAEHLLPLAPNLRSLHIRVASYQFASCFSALSKISLAELSLHLGSVAAGVAPLLASLSFIIATSAIESTVV